MKNITKEKLILENSADELAYYISQHKNIEDTRYIEFMKQDDFTEFLTGIDALSIGEYCYSVDDKKYLWTRTKLLSIFYTQIILSLIEEMKINCDAKLNVWFLNDSLKTSIKLKRSINNIELNFNLELIVHITRENTLKFLMSDEPIFDIDVMNTDYVQCFVNSACSTFEQLIKWTILN